MAAEKVRLKFRVSSTKEPKWTEKWGVNLTAGEEFHVTDKLLKLPFQETPPKTVCTFSVDRGALLFQHLDLDRLATRNGTPENECNPSVGDKILIGGTILVEVLVAPLVRASARADESPGPQVREIPEMKDLDRKPTADGPTLTLTDTTASTLPILSNASRSLEIDEPSLKMVRPELAEGMPKFSLPPEPKIELANSPHSHRDDSLDSRMAAITESALGGVRPLYPSKAKLGTRQTLSEKIFGAVAKVLKRDELNPPRDRFPLDADSTEPGIQMDRPDVKPWKPAEKVLRSEYTASTQVHRTPQKPWVPAPAPAGARLRGRALVFLVAAAGALMLAVGVLKISNQFGGDSTEKSEEAISRPEMSPGIPVDVIEEKIRKMRRR